MKRIARNQHLHVINNIYGNKDLNYFYINICGVLCWSHRELSPNSEQLNYASKFENIDSFLQVLISEKSELKK
jgi:hypothetical protein